MANDSILIQVQLGSPTKANINAVTRQIQSALSNVSANVQIQNGRQAAQQLQTIKNKTDSATKSMNSFGEAIGLSGRRFLAFTSAVAVVGRLTSALSQATREAIKFEREFVKLAQVFDTDVKSLGSLQNSMSKLAQEFGLSATVVAKTSVVLAQSGLTARQTEQAMRTLAKTTLAATFDSLAASTEGAVAIMAQFGTEASKLETQLGAINAVSKRFAVESGDIIEAVRRAGGAFKAAGGNLNEFISLFTAVRSTTRESAETIATGFRTIFARLQRPKTIEFFRQLNIELTDGRGNFIGAFEAIKRLSRGLEEAGIRAGSLRFAEVVEQLGGIRQVSRVIPLLQQFSKAEKARQVAVAGGGSLDRDAAKAQETLSQAFARTTENFRALIREISQTATFQAIVKIALDLANSFIEVARSLKPLIPLIAAFGAIKIGGLASGALKKGFGGAGGTGGLGQGFNKGGFVPGTGNSDTVPAMLTPGEFVIRKSAVQAFGAENLAGINKYKYGGRIEDLGKIYTSIPRKSGYKRIKNRRLNDTSVFKKVTPTKKDLDLWNSLKGSFGKRFEKVLSNKFPVLGQSDPYRYAFLDFPEARAEAKFMKRGETYNKGENDKNLKGNTNSSIAAKNFLYENSSIRGNGIKNRSTKELATYALAKKPVTTYWADPEEWVRRSTGGIIQKFAKGGQVGTDTVPALLTPGEFVINKKSAEAFGYGNLGKINKYAKGGPVKKFANGGGVGDDFERATGKVLANARDGQKHVDTFIGSLGEFATEFKKGFSGAIQDIKSFESQVAKKIKQLQAGGASEEEIKKQQERKSKLSTARGVQTKTKSGKTAIAVRGGKATQQTVEHEVAHAVDEALGKQAGSDKKASATKGTFQSDLVEKMKPILEEQLRAQGKSEKQIQYRLKNEEIFADLMSKATPEMRKILVSTTDSAEGMEAIAQAARGAKKKGGRLKGLAGVDQDIYRDSKIGRTDAIIAKVRGDIASKEKGEVQRAKDLSAKNIEEIRTSRFKPKSTNIFAGFSGEATKRRRSEEEEKKAKQRRDAQNASLQNLFGRPRGGPSGPGGRPNKDQENAQEKATASLDNFAIRMASVSVLLSQTGLLEPIGKIASRAGDGLSKMLGSIAGGEENVNAFKDALVSGVSQLAIFGTALSGLGVDIGGLLKQGFAKSGGGGVAELVTGGFGRGRRVGAGLAARGASFGDIIGGAAKSAGNVADKAGAGNFGKVAAKASGAMGGFTSAVSAAAGPLLLIAGLTFLASKGIQVLADAAIGTAEKQKKLDEAIDAGNIQDAGAAAAELADAQRGAAGLTIAGSTAAGAAIGAAVGSFVPVLGTAVGALAGGLIGGTIAIVSSLDDFFYNTKAINIAAAKTAAALNATANSAKISSAKNERLFRENKLDEAFANIAKETSDSAKAIKEAQEFARQAKIGGDEEKIEEAGKKLASAQEAQQKAIQRNLPQIKELIKNQAKQNRGAKSLSEVLDTLPKQQAEQIRQRIKLDKELNGEAADLKEQFQEVVVAGQEVADGLNITALQKNIDDLNKLHSEQFNQQKKINELTGKQTTLGDTRANLSLQAGESIRGLTAAGSSFAGDISTATGLSELNQVISNANSALQQTGDTLHYVNSEGQNEIKTREEVNKILETGKIAQKEGIRLVKENSAALVQEITKRKANIQTLNNFVTDFAFSSGKDKRQKTQQFDSAQRVAAGLAAGKTVGEIQGVTQADKQASKALFEQFGDVAIFGGKTGKEVLGEARVQEFGGTEGIKKLAEAQGADAASLEKAIREGALSEQDQMIKDLKQLNAASNSAQQQNIMLFNEGVNIFAKSVLLQAEKAKQDQQVERNKKIEEIKKKAGTDPAVKAAQEDVEASKEALKVATDRRDEEEDFRKRMATGGVGEKDFNRIMAAGSVNQKAFTSTQTVGSRGGTYQVTIQQSAAEKFGLSEADQQMFKRLQGNKAMGISSADVVARRQAELEAAQEREKTTRSTLVNQRINAAGLSGPVGVSGASALADSVKKSEEDLQKRKEIADQEAETARLNNETEKLRQQNNANQPTEITVQTNSSLQVNGIDNDLANKVADATRPVVENVASDSVIAGINIMEVGGDVPPRGHGVLLGSTR